MTPLEFERKMDRILAQPDPAAVKRDAMILIVRELGVGIPAYLPALEKFATRMERDANRSHKMPTEPVL